MSSDRIGRRNGVRGGRRLGALLLSAAAACPLAARAQALQSGQSAFARDRDTAVADRLFAAFQPTGFALGELQIFPQLGVTAEGASNVYENNADARADLLFQLTPKVMAKFDSSDLIADVYARGTINQFVHDSSEDVDEAVVGLDLKREFQRYSYVYANGSFGQLELPRLSPESPVGAESPLNYFDEQGDAGIVYELNRVRLKARMDVDSRRYDNTTFAGPPPQGGSILQTGSLDRTRWATTEQVEYAISPATSVYVGGSLDWLNFWQQPPIVPYPRNSHGYEAFVGTSFELTDLARADLRVGYLQQDFNDRQLGAIAGLGLQGRLEYFPSRLTTVTFETRRSVQDTGVPNSPAFLETSGSIQVDHEYRRYIMIFGKATYEKDDYQFINRHDDLAFATVGVRYLTTSHWNLTVAYEYHMLHSHDCSCSVSYDDNRLMTNLTFQY
jgi:hypothetical protein